MSRLYPYHLLLNKEGTQAVEDAYQVYQVLFRLRLGSVYLAHADESNQSNLILKKFDISSRKSDAKLFLQSVSCKNNEAVATISLNNKSHPVKVHILYCEWLSDSGSARIALPLICYSFTHCIRETDTHKKSTKINKIR